VACGGDATPLLDGCHFTGNTANSGAGVSCESAAPIFVDCSFSGNAAVFFGGGTFCETSSPEFNGCTFSANAAWQGGGLYCRDSSLPQIWQCTLYGNDASIGSGLSVLSSSCPELVYTVIAFGLDGESVFCDGASAAILACCDIYGNEGGDWVGCIGNQLGTNGNITQDPQFCEPDDGNFRLQEGSPCAPFSPPNPECDLIGAWPVGCDPQSVSGEGAGRGASLLSAAWPNPCEAQLEVVYDAPTMSPGAPVHLEIYDPSGRLIRRVTQDCGPRSSLSIRWDGNDHDSRPVKTGTYFYRLVAGAATSTGSLILMR
jgi:hypothetical protein